MNEIGTGMVQMVKLTGGYQEKNYRSGNEKRRRWIRRTVLCLLLVFFGILGIRRGTNAYLARQAEGKLQTASSYKGIYQSFERVESKQLRLRRKWENHRGINLSIDMGVNLSGNRGNNGLTYMMSSASSAVSSVLGAVHDVTGVGGLGIGQYHQYMVEASAEDGSCLSGTEGGMDEDESYQDIATGGQQAGEGQSVMEKSDSAAGEAKNVDSVAGPDQWIVRGDYIYMLWMKGQSDEWIGPEPKLVIYHAVNGQMEQVYDADLDVSESSEMEMMISGNYLYLAMNDDSYEECYFEYYDEMMADGYVEQKCLLYVYDIAKPAKPLEKKHFTQSGSYYSMKIEGGYLYLITRFQYFMAQSHRSADLYIPKMGEEKLSPEDIYMQRDLYGTGYVVISAYRPSDSGEIELTDAKAVAGTGECIQWSSDTIYICSQVVPKTFDHTDRTGVTVLSYQEGEINGEDHLIVDGSIVRTREMDVNEARLYLPMQVSTYRGSFMEIEGWILPGWESVPLKIQMQEDAARIEKQNISFDGVGQKVHETDVILPKERIRNTGFQGQLLEVDEMNYIGVGHTDGDKQLKLVWYCFSEEDEPELQTSASLREYYSPVASDGRMIYFDRDRSLIGFCAIGSKGTFYYLYHYGQNAGSGVMEMQELCQENFESQWRASWIRGVMLHPEENILYMVGSGNRYMKALAKTIAMDS